ncbi:MAG TPA: two-component sensor histidine kinase [Roseburia sp.]|nr:two-component sensor histidine kinase [Roseburia sp.]
MISEYLKKFQSELITNKEEIHKSIQTLELQIKENKAFIKLLKEENDSNYESFSPRDINPKGREQIQHLEEQQKFLQEQLDTKKKEYASCIAKLNELNEVIAELEQKINDSDSDISDDIFRLKLLETQENERQRISRELHDSTVQNLTSLVHKTELCSKLIDMDKVRCKLELNIMSKTLRDIINDTRNMIYNLRPMSFDDIGLEVTIKRALEKLESSETKKINFSVVGESYKINPVIGITLLRIIQEACSNAICHADCSIIKVVLNYKPGTMILSIEDDGKGFAYEETECNCKADNSGFGLSMMKERVYLLSGKIDIHSKINAGTKIQVEVPIAE